MEVIKKVVAPVTAAKPVPSTSQIPVTVNNVAKPAPLKPLAGSDSKLAGAHKEAAEPKPETKPTTTAVPTVAPKAEAKPVATASQLATTVAGEKLAERKPEPAKQQEKLGPKLRRKGDIEKALRGGAHLVHTTEGLYRTVATGGAQNPVSKRRALAMIAQKLLTRTVENGESRYVLDRDAAQKATEKKAEEKPLSKAEGPLRPV